MILRGQRVLLPVGQLFVDAVVLMLWVWHSQAIFRQMKGSVRFEPVAMFQESAPHFDIRHIDAPLPEAYSFLAFGNLPAMIVSTNLRPDAWLHYRAKRWDSWWFLIHESVASLVWFGFGVYADGGRRGFSRAMARFLVLRCVFAPFVTVVWVARLGILAEGSFWMGMGAYALSLVARRIWR